MKLPDRAFFRIAGVGASYARRVGRHGADFFCDRIAIITQRDGIAIALGHFLSIKSGQA